MPKSTDPIHVTVHNSTAFALAGGDNRYKFTSASAGLSLANLYPKYNSRLQFTDHDPTLLPTGLVQFVFS